MTILPAVPGLMKLKSDWTFDTQPWSTALHLLKSVASPWLTPDLNFALTTLATALADEFLPNFGVANTNVNNTATDLSSAMGIEVTDSGAGAGTGGETDPLPINCVVRATFPVPLRYRGGRFGMSISGLDGTNQMAGSSRMWSDATVAAFQSAVGGLLEDFRGLPLPSGATAQPVAVSYFTGHALRPVPLVMDLGTSVEIQQRVCSRRKRLGRGVPGE